nr:immunoglobulin heavy chain junction region [Mus musculus]
CARDAGGYFDVW